MVPRILGYRRAIAEEELVLGAFQLGSRLVMALTERASRRSESMPARSLPMCAAARKAASMSFLWRRWRRKTGCQYIIPKKEYLGLRINNACLRGGVPLISPLFSIEKILK